MSSILIADDLEAMRRLLRRVLERRHTVVEAVDGAEALETLRAVHPDVAVLDVIMPGLSGLEVCRLVRADPELRHTGVVLISANAPAAEAHEVGADAFLVKPFLPSALLAAVDDALRGAVSRGPDNP
jgi:CheY-like chemotaxis protein